MFRIGRRLFQSSISRRSYHSDSDSFTIRINFRIVTKIAAVGLLSGAALAVGHDMIYDDPREKWIGMGPAWMVSGER